MPSPPAYPQGARYGGIGGIRIQVDRFSRIHNFLVNGSQKLSFDTCFPNSAQKRAIGAYFAYGHSLNCVESECRPSGYGGYIRDL